MGGRFTLLYHNEISLLHLSLMLLYLLFSQLMYYGLFFLLQLSQTHTVTVLLKLLSQNHTATVKHVHLFIINNKNQDLQSAEPFLLEAKQTREKNII